MHYAKLQVSASSTPGCLDISGPCLVTGKTYIVPAVPKDAFFRWYDGYGLIQTMLPGLTADQREFLMSGTSPEGWKQLYGEEE